jgi:hypothetical protein
MENAIIILVILAIILVPLGIAAASIGKRVGEGMEYRMRVKANQRAMDTAQRRYNRAEAHAAWMQVLPVFAWGLSISAVLLIIAIALAGARTAWGIGAAKVHKAHMQARLIELDKSTRQYPLLTSVDQDGTWWVHNPNTSETLRLVSERTANTQMIAAAGLVQASGAIAQEAAKAADSGGVAAVNPPIVIDAEE